MLNLTDQNNDPLQIYRKLYVGMHPYQLIKNRFSNQNLSTNNYCIFEAGFRDVGLPVELYRILKFRKYIGVDIIKESKVCVFGSFSTNESIYERYIDHLREIQFDTQLTGQEFSNTYILNFDKRIESFIIENEQLDEKIDIAIFSQILHLLKNRSEVLDIIKWCYKNSASSSYLLLSLRTNPMNFWGEVAENVIIFNNDDVLEIIRAFNGTILETCQDSAFMCYLIQKNN